MYCHQSFERYGNRTNEVAQEELEKAKEKWINAQNHYVSGRFSLGNLIRFWRFAYAAGWYLGGVAHYVAAFLIVALFIGSQLILVIFGAIVTSAVVLVLSGFNRAYGAYYSIYFRCPHAGCHEPMDIPVYRCNKCNTEHTRLWPSIYGIFYHQCLGPNDSYCGNGLPTLDWQLPLLDLPSRKELDRVCPSCTRPLVKEIGQATIYHFPMCWWSTCWKIEFLGRFYSAIDGSLRTRTSA